jgi:AcrR family transcriptional regulator
LPAKKRYQKTQLTKKRRTRRTTEEIVDRIIEAACDEFERKGYAGAKTAAIARKAGVAEALIFSNFGSKDQLFHDAIFKPLDRHFVQFSGARVSSHDAEGLRRGTLEYIGELQRFVAQHSRMLKSLVAIQLYTNDKVKGLSQVAGLHEFFSHAAARAAVRLGDKPRIDPRLIARVSFATILASVVFRDWLFPDGLADETQINQAIRDFMLDGLGANIESGSRRQAARKTRGRAAS